MERDELAAIFYGDEERPAVWATDCPIRFDVWYAFAREENKCVTSAAWARLHVARAGRWGVVPNAWRALFAPPPESLPGVNVQLAELSSYDQLVGNGTIGEEAAA